MKQESDCLLKTAINNLYENKFKEFQSALIIEQRVMIDSLINEKILFKSNDYEVQSNQCDTLVIVKFQNKTRIYVDSIFAKVIDNQILISPQSIVKLFNKEVEFSYPIAKRFITDQRFREAVDWLKGISLENGEKELLMGKCYFELHEYSKAIVQLRDSYESDNMEAGILLSESLQFVDKRDESIKILKRLAEKNNTTAMVRLGEIYDTFSSQFGYSPPEDANDGSSYEWYLKAAMLKDSIAMLQIGTIFEFGINKKVNLDSAVYWYNKAAQLNLAIAYSQIAKLHFQGKYFTKSREKGMEEINKAIRLNPKTGYFELGMFYKNGRILPYDSEKALFYLQKADSLNHPLARFHIDQLQNSPSESLRRS